MENKTSKYSVKKCCPCCGKSFIDNSHNHCKITCSPKCRQKWANTNHPEEHIKRKMDLRYYILSHLGIELTDVEKLEIDESIKSEICEICGRSMIGREAHIDHETF
jgi:hypothetical protein